MAAQRALIVDDEPDIRELLEITLGRMGIETSAAPDLATAHKLLTQHEFDLCLTDMQLPDGNGLELVEYIARELPALPVAVITAFGSMDVAINALKTGAFDFVQKPVNLEQLRHLVDTALKMVPLQETESTTTRLTGTSDVMNQVRGQIGKLARSQAPIYISGESGSGKEVAARLIHEQGPRAEQPFIPVNCGAIPGELMESEFFGHTKGAFTGAVSDKQGLFKSASNGTLFLDEVADLPLSMQVKLLRAIQEKAIRAVGTHNEESIDVRILSATHKDLADEVAAGRFRQDLYYRLNVIELNIPALRARPSDVPQHTKQILERLSRDYDAPQPKLSPQASELLNQYSFPGNVRELENILERAFTLCEDSIIEPADLQLSTDEAISQQLSVRPTTSPTANPISSPVLPPTPSTGATATELDTAPVASQANTGSLNQPKLAPGQSLEEYLEEIERQLINQALEAARWNKTAAAKDLGITFRALRYRLKKLELE
jgi:two-component system response regulator PilR (NtrC family)